MLEDSDVMLDVDVLKTDDEDDDDDDVVSGTSVSKTIT